MRGQVMLNRRSFFTAAVGLGAAATATAADQSPGAGAAPAKKRVKLGICTYSYWHFRTAKVPIETVIVMT